jgi:NAD(P)-dependent dehydrogenase (short-subunit alcohol dehydrogenase family)
MTDVLGSRRSLAVAAAVLGAGWAFRRIRAGRRSLTGQIALVTGASRGLGFLIARQLGREGCRVVICARDEDELKRARRALMCEDIEVLALRCEVEDSAQVDRLVSEVVRQFGRVDIVVNNAGIIQVGPFDSFALPDFQQAMSVNFWGTVHTTLAALPHMRANQSGRIVNVTSIGGKVAVPHLLPYDCAKFAAVGFSEGLCAELARAGISVTTVVPGLMRTGSHRFASFTGDRRGESRWFSLAARLPGLAMSADRAAKRIVRAAKRRDAELVIGLPAKLLRLAKELVPGVILRLLSSINRLLPSAPPSTAPS